MPEDKEQQDKQQRAQQEHIEHLGRPRSNAVFEPPKRQGEKKKPPGKLNQSFKSHSHFVNFMLGKAGVPEEEIEATKQREKDAKERGIWIKPFEVPPKSRGMGESFSSHMNFLKVLAGGGEIPEQEKKDTAAKKAFLDQWRKDNPGKEPDDDMDEYQHQKWSVKDSFKAQGSFLKDLFGKAKPQSEHQGSDDDTGDKAKQGGVRDELAKQSPKAQRQPKKAMKLGFNYESAKTKFKERSAAFAKKLSDGFHSAGGGQGFKYFKDMAKKLLSGNKKQPGQTGQQGQTPGKMPQFSTQVDLSKAPQQFSAQAAPGMDFTAQNKSKPFELKKDQPKPFDLSKQPGNMFAGMMNKQQGSTGQGSKPTMAQGTA